MSSPTAWSRPRWPASTGSTWAIERCSVGRPCWVSASTRGCSGGSRSTVSPPRRSSHWSGSGATSRTTATATCGSAMRSSAKPPTRACPSGPVADSTRRPVAPWRARPRNPKSSRPPLQALLPRRRRRPCVALQPPGCRAGPQCVGVRGSRGTLSPGVGRRRRCGGRRDGACRRLGGVRPGRGAGRRAARRDAVVHGGPTAGERRPDPRGGAAVPPLRGRWPFRTDRAGGAVGAPRSPHGRRHHRTAGRSLSRPSLHDARRYPRSTGAIRRGHRAGTALDQSGGDVR